MLKNVNKRRVAAEPECRAAMENRNIHIIVVEDEPVSRTKLAGYFENEGYRVSEAGNGEEMLALMERDDADLVLLDINLPGDDGLFLTRWLRGQSDIGIILVTGRCDDVDRIVGLEMGADDYVTKPFNYRELLARVKNLLRRTTELRRLRQGGTQKRFSGWEFDLQTRRLTSPQGKKVELTRAEYELLVAFVKHPGIVMSRDRLLDNVSHRKWAPSDRTIDVLVRRLRQKIEKDPTMPELIATAHGEGYLFASTVL